MSNNNSWNAASVVKRHITDKYELYPPEETILDYAKDRLGGWRMLDIGVGLGRTTAHFAPLVKEYVGIDYSAAMVDTFHKTFPEPASNIRVQLGDVRNMQEFDAGQFDFILFSYNGIDYVSHDERMLAFREIKRLGKPGGLFAFSSHNLQYIFNLYRLKTKGGIKEVAYGCYRYLRLIYENGLPARYAHRDHAILNDGAFHFKLSTYYIKPTVQYDILKQLDFKNIRLLSLKTGLEIGMTQASCTTQDSWLYYLCEFSH